MHIASHSADPFFSHVSLLPNSIYVGNIGVVNRLISDDGMTTAPLHPPWDRLMMQYPLWTKSLFLF